MVFQNKKELLIILSNLKKIGDGSQGTCFYDPKNNCVYKIYNGFINEDTDDDFVYSKDTIMRFSNIKTKTFVFPSDVIYVNNYIVGYMTPYVKAKPLYNINPLLISLDKLERNIKEVKKDIKILSDNKILIFDAMYNILYGNKLYMTDTDEFGCSYYNFNYEKKNNQYFDYELYYFLVDGYFNTFISNYYNLEKMYKNKCANILEFLRLFRKYLSEYEGKEIQKLIEAKNCINKDKVKTRYIRFLNGG